MTETISLNDLFEISRRLVDDRNPDAGEFILYARPARLDPYGKVSYFVRCDDEMALYYTYKPILGINQIEPTDILTA